MTTTTTPTEETPKLTTTTPIELTPELIIANTRKILLNLVYKTVIGGFRFDGFTSKKATSDDAEYPVITDLYLNHIKLDGFAENEAMSMYGIEAVLDWLGNLGLMDGSVEFRLNMSIPADED